MSDALVLRQRIGIRVVSFVTLRTTYIIAYFYSQTPPDMERAATELARSIQDAMVALFNLQTALINYYSKRSSKGLIEAFQTIRDAFRADWEKYILFFQGCQGYGEDYISLCQYAATHKPADTLAFARDVLGMARNLSRDVATLKRTHEKALADIELHTKKLPTEFRKPSGQRSPSNYYYDVNISLTDPFPLTDPLHSAANAESLANFVEMANASLRPDGNQALMDSNEALRMMGTSLRDLDTFWRDQVDQLAAVAKPGSMFRPSKEELRQSAEMWRRNQSALQRVISSISASSDAVQVDPVGAPERRKERGRSKKGGFWSKFFGFFFN